MNSANRARLAMCAAVLVLAGCQSGAHRTEPGSHTSGTAARSAGHKTVTAGEADGGHTITVAIGDDVAVVLHSTYWQLAPLTGGVLQASGPAAVAPATPKSCVPGQGCGTVTQTFRAKAGGRALITASRTSCGEAMRCTGSNGSYHLTVVVR
ncbi:MAG: hypothetical protein QOD31_2865 [Pseudonocardiales bacterium]|nr:hypothetical protein [Pseudonocardiales bacterium]